jgi:hypothetical protein
MSRLVLIKDHQILAEYNLSKERFTIGRLSDNDLRIDHPTVSSHHAVVINILNDSFIEDLNSTNGTYINGRLIKKHALQQGDLITVGHHQLRFIDSHLHELDANEFSQTLVITPETSATHYRNISDPLVTAQLPQAKLQILSGAHAGRELMLNKSVTTLGKQDVQVASISLQTDGFFITHTHSSQPNHYPSVNGQSIGSSAYKLSPQDVIEVAGVKLAFLNVD